MTLNWSNLLYATLLAIYLILALLVWPWTVVVTRLIERQATWRAANAAAWARWNEMRTERL